MAPRKPKVVERPGNIQREKIKTKNKIESKTGGKALWWKLQEKHHEEVFALMDYLEQHQPLRRLLNRYYRALFRNRMLLTDASLRTAKAMGLPADRLTLNIPKSIINTKKNRIAKNNNRTRFMTSGADYHLREQGFLMEKYCAGLDFEQDTHGAMKRMFTDSEVCGTGLVKVYDDEDDVVTEWTDIDEIVVDDDDVKGGKTFMLHQDTWISREMALEEYADILGEENIINAVGDNRREASTGVVSDRIRLIESWKLPFRKGGDDGLHVISIVNSSHAEKWDLDCFPFAELRSEATEGWYGEGTCERVNPKTTELNKLLRNSHLAINLCSIPSYLVHEDDEITDAEFNNEIGHIKRFTGQTPPTKEVSNSVPPEVWRQIDWLYSMAFREEGVSEQSAAARKEPGITAAVAMREQSDLETDRCALLSQDFEKARVDINKLQLLAAKRLVERGKSYKVRVPMDGDGYLELDFKELDFDRNKVIMQPYPSSSLPQTPTARAQWIEERVDKGTITIEVGRKLMQMPDIEAEMTSITAPERDVEKTLDHIMRAKPDKDGKLVYLPPEPFQNLELAWKVATSKYLQLRLIPGVPRARLELIQRFATQAKRMWDKAQLEEKAKLAAMQGPPPGAPPMMSQPAMPMMGAAGAPAGPPL